MDGKPAGRRGTVPFPGARKRGPVRRGLRTGRAAGLAVTACGLAAGCAGTATPVAAPAARAPFVYVTAKGPNEVCQFGSLGSGALRPLTPKTVPSGPGPYDVAVTPQGTSVYVVDRPGSAAGEVSQYTISPATGKLTPKSPKTVPTAGGPSGIIAVAPDGKSAYVPDFTAKAISQYSISPATGKLTPMSPKTVAAPGGPSGIKIAPDGRYAYITNTTLLIAPQGTHVAAQGKYASTTNVKANTVSVFRISPGTGALSAKPASTAATVLHPEAIALAPDGGNAYVTSENKGVLSQFAISPATGKITPLSPATVTIPPSGSLGVAVTPAK
jgi:6-phosphogluconolactonase